jgi:hypothetical protein
VNEVNFALENREAVCQRLKESHHSLPTLLHIGSMMLSTDMEELKAHKAKIKSLIPGIDSLSFQYALSMSMSEKVNVPESVVAISNL